MSSTKGKGKAQPNSGASGIRQNPPNAVASSSTAPPPIQQKIDIYRPIASAIQKDIAHLLPISTTPLSTSAASIFSLDPVVYNTRLKGKNILLDVAAIPSQPSVLIKGKKLHAGHPEIRKSVREEIEHKVHEREVDGVEGLRKVRRKLKERDTGSVFKSGMEISYSSILPLHHMHLTYLAHLLNLPPLPTSLVASSTLPPGVSSEGVQSRLSKADLTGLRITVLSSRNTSLTSISGIIIEETSSTFRLITPKSKLLVIPKSGTLFEILIPAYAPKHFSSSSELYEDNGERPEPIDWEAHVKSCPQIRVLLLGTAFGFRSGERAGRKFRPAQGGGGGSGWGEDWVKGEWAGVLDSVENDLERRNGGKPIEAQREKKGKRHRNKGRRKDPPSWGRFEVP